MIPSLPQKKTCIALVLLLAMVVNFSFGPAHVTFHHDTEHGHHDTHEDHGHGHGDSEEHPTHSAQDHEQDMLLSRVRALAEVEMELAALPFVALATEEQQLPAEWIAEIDSPRPPPAWHGLPSGLRGPPSLS